MAVAIFPHMKTKNTKSKISSISLPFGHGIPGKAITLGPNPIILDAIRKLETSRKKPITEPEFMRIIGDFQRRGVEPFVQQEIPLEDALLDDCELCQELKKERMH